MSDDLSIEILKQTRPLTRYAESLDRSNAEDLVQSTVLKAIANSHSFTPGTNLIGWLCTILRNIYFNERRKLKQSQNTISWEDGDTRQEPVALDNPEYALILKEILMQIDALPPDKKTLILFIIENRTYEEIAAIYGIPAGTVKSRLSRLRHYLRETTFWS